MPTNPPVKLEDAERLLAESQRLKEQARAMRPRSRWLAARLDELLAENHLSERIRQALGEP